MVKYRTLCGELTHAPLKVTSKTNSLMLKATEQCCMLSEAEAGCVHIQFQVFSCSCTTRTTSSSAVVCTPLCQNKLTLHANANNLNAEIGIPRGDSNAKKRPKHRARSDSQRYAEDEMHDTS
eukprot:1157510-Pelagomonas_calceolata.AAC.1